MKRAELVRPDALRQSTIASFDACPLSLRFSLESLLRQSPGPIGAIGARGVLFHRFAAAAINWMRIHLEREIGVDMAMELLAEVVTQRDVPDEEVVHLPLRELRWLRVLVTKWVYRQRFNIERVVDVERRLYAEIPVRGLNGETYLRKITGQLDLLLAGPRSLEATVLDWKTGFAPPSIRRATVPGQERADDKLSDMGYIQQIVYGFLVLANFPSVERVIMREYYVMAQDDPVREAKVDRWEMERIQDVLASQVALIDAAIDAGPLSARWVAIPGAHCGWCPKPRACPIKDEVGIPADEREAQRLAQEWIVAGKVREERLPYIKGYVDLHGEIPIAHSKGRRAVGWVPNKTGTGRSFKLYEPEDAAPSPFDPLLEAAARERGVLTDD